MLKYGYRSFRLDILEYCERSKCIIREQHYIDTLSPFYNICAKAGSSLGRLTADTTRFKLRMARMGLLHKRSSSKSSLMEFIVENLTMKVNRLELNCIKLHKELKSVTLKPKFKQSDLTRLKKLQSSSTAESVVVLDLNSGITTEYPSARNAAMALNSSNSTIMNKLNGKNDKPYKGIYVISKGGKCRLEISSILVITAAPQ